MFYISQYQNVLFELHLVLLFLLFLFHPEGVNFKGMRAYLQELYNIYQIVMKKNIEANKIKQILGNLVDPMGNSIYEACSIIRNRLLKVAGPSRMKFYDITGKRGGCHQIMLDRELVIVEHEKLEKMMNR